MFVTQNKPTHSIQGHVKWSHEEINRPTYK